MPQTRSPQRRTPPPNPTRGVATLLAAVLLLLPLLTAPAWAEPDQGMLSGIDTTESRAHWIDRSTVAWPVAQGSARDHTLLYSPTAGIGAGPGGITGAHQRIRLTPAPGGLTERQRADFPHLADSAAFTVHPRDRRRVTAALRSQVVAAQHEDGSLVAATGVQLPGVLDDVYADAADARLGPTWRGGVPTLAVWAPTARTVRLQLHDGPGDQSPRGVAMHRDRRTGVWSVTGARSWRNAHYTFEVTVYAPAAGEIVTNTVTDPYSLSVSADSALSRLVDIDDPGLAPRGWKDLRKPADPGRSPSFYELHVRDFSASDRTVPTDQRGTYAAFTDPGSDGMRALSSLADDGMTHVHLLPAFDFATVPENRSDRDEPDCDFAAMAPDSPDQQECVAATAATDSFNWGYDPLHYTVPEGSYASDPDGGARVTEFRGMVAGLNRAGLRVVMDVVYNHTHASGQDPRSVLDRVVPGYYHRLLEDGSVATSTCCANTAPEHTMMGKLVVDSVVAWARHYKVDGFRFDLMGHHPKANMTDVRSALDALTLADDGVDGSAVVLYGEGWDFGEVAGGARFEQATQANMAGTGIATFDDRMRDAVRGGGPFDADPRVQGFASGLYTAPNGAPVNGSPDEQRARLLHYQDLVKVGLTGGLRDYRFTDSSGRTVTGADVDYNGSPAGYTAAPGEAVSYVEAHDNETLYDALAYKLPSDTPLDRRARMQTVANATAVLGQGTTFLHAGGERLRSKSLDRNSYDSGDWFNRLLWDCRDGNNFGVGLPPVADNQDKWVYARPLLADPALRADCAAIDLTRDQTGELLRIAGSTPAFSLGTAARVQDRLTFPTSGTGETPGVVTMHIDAQGLDGRWSAVTVIFNATPQTLDQRVPALAGTDTALHPVQRESADPLVRGAAVDTGTGTVTVPAATVAVFVTSG